LPSPSGVKCRCWPRSRPGTEAVETAYEVEWLIGSHGAGQRCTNGLWATDIIIIHNTNIK